MRRAILPQPIRCNSLRTAVARRPAVVKCCFMAAGCSLSLSAKCPYRTLGVVQDADEDAIKVAFRRKAKQMHPDVSSDPLAGLAFMECQHAYQTLLDPEKRAKYDKTLRPRATSQVFSYLNARSAARHGVTAARVPSRSPYVDRPELYSTMLELLEQVKSCAKHLEKEVIATNGSRRGFASAAAPFASRKHLVVDADCGEQECCEPWLYYAAQATTERESASRRRV